jgi:isocitrate dehydrogenase
MPRYKKISVPDEGEKIFIEHNKLLVPDNPIITYIEGDGTGPDIWKAAQMVFDSAVEKAYGTKRKIYWTEIFAGEKAVKIYGKNKWLPDETVEALKEFTIAIKGPLTTPVSSGMRSINVTLRQLLDLFACVRPVKYYPGAPSPMKKPQDLDIVLFRENTEDVYAGVEFQSGSKETEEFIKYINKKFNKNIRIPSGIGIKPISKFASDRLIKKAIEYAILHKRKRVTMVHKGNIMKFTEGAFKDWGYKIAKSLYSDIIVTEDQLENGKIPEGKILLNDRIADTMFQQLMLRPKEFDVIATPNLNGDYISEAAAGQIGGVGMAPGANISYTTAIFEATHGTAPKYTGMDKVNPSAIILSGVMMFEYMGWMKAARLIQKALTKTIKSRIVTYDFARQMKGAKEVKTSEFARAIVKNMS